MLLSPGQAIQARFALPSGLHSPNIVASDRSLATFFSANLADHSLDGSVFFVSEQ